MSHKIYFGPHVDQIDLDYLKLVNHNLNVVSAHKEEEYVDKVCVATRKSPNAGLDIKWVLPDDPLTQRLDLKLCEI